MLKVKAEKQAEKERKIEAYKLQKALEAGEITEAELAERQAELNGETAEDTEGDSETLTTQLPIQQHKLPNFKP